MKAKEEWEFVKKIPKRIPAHMISNIVCGVILFGMISFGIVFLNEKIDIVEDKINKVYKVIKNDYEDDLK